MGECFLDPPRPGQGDGKVQVGTGELRTDRHRALVGPDRRSQVAAAQLDVADVQVGQRLVGIQAQRPLILPDRPGRVAGGRARDPQVHMYRGLDGVGGQARGEGRDRAGVVAVLVVKRSERAEHPGVTGKHGPCPHQQVFGPFSVATQARVFGEEAEDHHPAASHGERFTGGGGARPLRGVRHVQRRQRQRPQVRVGGRAEPVHPFGRVSAEALARPHPPDEEAGQSLEPRQGTGLVGVQEQAGGQIHPRGVGHREETRRHRIERLRRAPPLVHLRL